jgi:hypothetical protein
VTLRGDAPGRAVSHGITCEWEIPPDAFMVRILDATRRGRMNGLARYRPEFSLGG